MIRSLHKLNAKFVQTVSSYGTHSDGGGLALVVKSDRRAWQFRYTWNGREEYLGLGSASTVTLADARAKAAEARSKIAKGINPKAIKTIVPTFGELADEHIAAMRSNWRNDKHTAQWIMTLEVYAAPLRSMSVDKIETSDVLKVLEPFWLTKNETANRLRGRIEAILARATVKGLRQGANPAQWRNHLDQLLPAQSSLKRGHHGAMPYAEVPVFIQRLNKSASISALAFEFLILTAARTGEVLGAKWSEFDLEAGIWTVPAARMKAAKLHRVPLSSWATSILRRVGQLRTDGQDTFVFLGRDGKKPLSNMALEAILRRFGLKANNVTVHGFRSAFRDWAGEETEFAREVAEQALAHVVGDAVEQAYRRGDALEKRRVMMDEWSAFCRCLQ